MRNTKLLLTLASLFLLVGCANQGQDSTSKDTSSSSQVNPEPADDKTYTLINGGFESTNLKGWTVEYGNAFSDDSVSSTKTFSYDYDEDHKEININQEGNWYLSGKGFDGSFSYYRIGAIRSSNFYVPKDAAYISMKLAGGATVDGKGDEAGTKNIHSICYVGVYTAKEDKLISMVTNKYFIEHTDPYVDVDKYNNEVYCTDNFTTYKVMLKDYVGQELYLRVVDNDRSPYYGYISVDDVRVGKEDPQSPGAYYVKTIDGGKEVIAPSQYDIANGDFECGSLSGWTVTEGLAFSDKGVNNEETWWRELLPYQRDGKYHYGLYRPTATGRMRSTSFVLGGSGYVTFKLGGCKYNNLTYLSFYVIDGENDVEVARYSNNQYKDQQFPFIANGMRLLNLNQYVADLREYIGQTMYIEVVDNCTSDEDLGCITLDSICTYNPEKPTFYNVNNYPALSTVSAEVLPDNEYQVKNGSFETGDLSFWTKSWTDESGRIGYVSDAYGWWDENLPYNKKGIYLFTGVSDEAKTGYIESEPFTIGGINKMSFLLGGGRDPRLCYVSIIEKDTDTELARYANRFFHDLGINNNLINNGSNLLNMVRYVADLSAFAGKEVYIRVSDYAMADWGLIAVDSFVTYYPSEQALPEQYYDAVSVMPKAAIGAENEYQVLNGDFEAGSLEGWTLDGDFGRLSFADVWWNEWYSFDKQGYYFFGGDGKGYEENTGTLVSSAFTVGGINKISFKLGAGKNKDVCYMAIIDATTGDELLQFSNYKFKDFEPTDKYYYGGQPIDLANDGIYLFNMVTYIADLSSLEGRSVKIKIVDNAIGDWGLINADDFVTYYTDVTDLPVGYEAQY